MATSTLSKSQLLLIHQQQCEEYNDGYNNENVDELLQVFGGINNVLTMLLSSNNEINEQQLSQIHQLITQNNSQCNETLIAHNDSNTIEIRENEESPEWRYCFSTTNTYIHSLFGYAKAEKIQNIIHSKCFVCTTFLAFLLVGIILPETGLFPSSLH